MEPSQILEPQKMKTLENNRDMSKYYKYQKDHGHKTNDCWKLNKEVEKLIQRGLLR